MSTPPPSSLRLELLGGARLHGPEGVSKLERKTAALLALVALDGALPRARAAGLLWPDSPEATARNNLRQLLRRLRTLAGVPLVDGVEALALMEGVVVDVHAPTAGSEAPATAQLLAGLDYDDLPELGAWLAARRETVAGAHSQALAREVERLEKGGDIAGALALARQGVELEPLSEEAWRRLMRLQYLSGDRGAALATYEKCRSVLKAELGVLPLQETTALAREISASMPRIPVGRAMGPRIPLAVLRPPVLAGREREWALMEEAWEAGKGIVLGGPPGVGKSRLMQDFLHSKGRTLFCSGRPYDKTVPYGTHARTYRQVLDLLEGAPLEPWVQREMARILPSLGEPPPPFRDESDKLRFFQAKIELHKMAHARGYTSLGFDDLQFVDAASAEAGAYILFQLQADPSFPVRTVHCFRSGELPEGTMAILRDAAEAGQMLLIELEPLDSQGVDSLLGSLGVPGVEHLSGQMASYTGGNPLFLLETVKHLLETQGLESGQPLQLPPAAVSRVVAGRLQRLSPGALQLARVLAVLGTHFTLELAGEVLEAAPVELGTWWSELDAAQLVRGAAFSHDVLAETVLTDMPGPVRQLLHRQSAQSLEARGANPALVAWHWHEGGEPMRALPQFLRAADEARAALLHEQANAFTQMADTLRTQSSTAPPRA